MKKVLHLVRHLLRSYPFTLLCLALIVYLSLFVNMPETPLDGVAFIDKWTHLVMYGGTCSVMWIEYLRRHRRPLAWQLFLYAWAGPVALGGVIEIVQPHFGRSGEWLDFVADATGATLAVGVGLSFRRFQRRQWSRKDGLKPEPRQS